MLTYANDSLTYCLPDRIKTSDCNSVILGLPIHAFAGYSLLTYAIDSLT